MHFDHLNTITLRATISDSAKSDIGGHSTDISLVGYRGTQYRYLFGIEMVPLVVFQNESEVGAPDDDRE